MHLRAFVKSDQIRLSAELCKKHKRQRVNNSALFLNTLSDLSFTLEIFVSCIIWSKTF